MPAYVYECTACEHGFETMQGIRDAKLLDCPECDEPKLRRLVGNAIVIFKGAWGDKRRKTVDQRLKRQEKRVETALKNGKMSQLEVDQMAFIRNRYAKTSPYLVEPSEVKGEKKEYPDEVKYKSSAPPVEPELGGDSRKARNNPNEV